MMANPIGGPGKNEPEKTKKKNTSRKKEKV